MKMEAVYSPEKLVNFYQPTTSSAVANSHIQQFTTARTKSFQSAVSSPFVACRRIPTLSSASVLTFLPVRDCLTTN
jgi:hypothetical protein